MSKKSKPASRWNAGNERYSKADSEVLARFREGPGWFRGARVRGRK